VHTAVECEHREKKEDEGGGRLEHWDKSQQDEKGGAKEKCPQVQPKHEVITQHLDMNCGMEDLHKLESRMACSFRPQSLNLGCFEDGQDAYICLKLWERSELTADSNVPEIEDLFLSKEALDQAKCAYSALCRLVGPWFEGKDSCTGSLWSQEVFAAIKLKTLGRMLFPVILEHIRKQFESDPVSATNDMAGFTEFLENCTTENALEQVEKQLLLKELLIGRRVKNLPMWTGLISPWTDKSKKIKHIEPRQRGERCERDDVREHCAIKASIIAIEASIVAIKASIVMIAIVVSSASAKPTTQAGLGAKVASA